MEWAVALSQDFFLKSDVMLLRIKVTAFKNKIISGFCMLDVFYNC